MPDHSHIKVTSLTKDGHEHEPKIDEWRKFVTAPTRTVEIAGPFQFDWPTYFFVEVADVRAKAQLSKLKLPGTHAGTVYAVAPRAAWKWMEKQGGDWTKRLADHKAKKYSEQQLACDLFNNGVRAVLNVIFNDNHVLLMDWAKREAARASIIFGFYMDKAGWDSLKGKD